MAADNWQERTELLLGKEKLEILEKSHVLVAGLGGVGGQAAEVLCRAGVGSLTIIDADSFHPSNRNRQTGAFISTENIPKTQVFEKRLRDINPAIRLTVINEFIAGDRVEEIAKMPVDYILDAIDSLAPKIYLIYHSLKNNKKLISSMGAGGKTDPGLIEITDFSKTHNDKLARMLRKRLHKLGVYSGFDVVFSPEKTSKDSLKYIDNEQNKKTTVGTISYMPMMFGAFMAAHVIRELTGLNNKETEK
jgi:tRNA A37 threonylcarbamoyladenosine dehydratase